MSTTVAVPFAGTQEQEMLLAKVIVKYKETEGALIPVLHEAQEIYGYLPIEVQKLVANGLDVSLTEVYGVVTFYTQFSLYPKGKYKIGLCLGTACYVKGAAAVLDKIKACINLEVGKTSEDGKYSLEATRCIGACGLAPVMMVNEDVYGKLVPDDVEGILAKYKA